MIPISKVFIRGIVPALPTPLTKDGGVDLPAAKRLALWLCDQGVHGLFLAGSTGEGLFLDPADRMRLLETILEAVGDRLTVIAQIADIRFESTLKLARHAQSAGAPVLSALPPIYNGYTPSELESYFVRLARAIDRPLLLYSIDRTGNPLSVELLDHLLREPNIIGVKWSHPNYYALERLKALNGGDVNVLNGSDEALLGGLALGADGGIGSTYNVIPALFVKLYDAFQSGDVLAARGFQKTANDIIQVLLRFNVLQAIRVVLDWMDLPIGNATYPAQGLDAPACRAMAEALSWYDFKAQRG